jgi:hypothetical protein
VYEVRVLLHDAYGSTCCSLKLTTWLKTFLGLQHEHAALHAFLRWVCLSTMFYVVITSI